MVGKVGDDAVAVLEVGGEHAVVSGEMSAGTRNEGDEAEADYGALGTVRARFSG